VSGVRALVVGAGGAARASARALGGAGAEVVVVARRPEAAEAAADLAGTASHGARAAAWGDLPEEAHAAGLVLNGTPLGMEDEPPPFPVAVLTDRHVVVDLVYEPPETPLLAAGRAVGATTVGGRGMLLHQGAAAFRLWTGIEAPLPVMRRALDHRC